MPRIGLFGGSFDPVHTGHLLVARAAMEEARLERLYFILAARSPFKTEADPAPAATRARLLRLALAGQPEFELDTQELGRKGPSFTIDTIRDYRKRFPNAAIHYLIGADHVPLLPRWREAGELAGAADFLVIPRPGEPAAPFPKPFRGRELKGFPFGVSSTLLRERARAGLPLDGLTPTAVAEAIQRDKIYQPL